MILTILRAAAAIIASLWLGTGLALADTPKKGGTLNFGVVAEPPNYDCHGSTTFALVHPIAPHYSLLVKFDGKEYPKVIPDLAESWTVAPDKMSYTFKLRSGVKFHDGSPLTSADVKASYDRIISPPEGVVSIRKAYYEDLIVETPDPNTVVFKLKNPMAGVMEALASPFNCIYSAAKLKQNPRYPETEIMGSGAFSFVGHVKGSTWEGKRFDGYYNKERPYLDGYKIFFVKSAAVVPGILGGQFDAEFRGRNPQEKGQLLDKMKDNLEVFEGTWVNNLMLVFNTTRKPFDDVKVRQALSMAIDRWGGSDALSKISILKFVGGVMRPGYSMSLPRSGTGQASRVFEGHQQVARGCQEDAEGGRPEGPQVQAPEPQHCGALHAGRHLLHRPVAAHRRDGGARAARDQAVPGPGRQGRLRRGGGVPGRLHGRSNRAVLEVPDEGAVAQRLLGSHGQEDRRHVSEAAAHRRCRRAHQDRA